MFVDRVLVGWVVPFDKWSNRLTMFFFCDFGVVCKALDVVVVIIIIIIIILIILCSVHLVKSQTYAADKQWDLASVVAARREPAQHGSTIFCHRNPTYSKELWLADCPVVTTWLFSHIPVVFWGAVVVWPDFCQAADGEVLGVAVYNRPWHSPMKSEKILKRGKKCHEICVKHSVSWDHAIRNLFG